MYYLVPVLVLVLSIYCKQQRVSNPLIVVQRASWLRCHVLCYT